MLLSIVSVSFALMLLRNVPIHDLTLAVVFLPVAVGTTTGSASGQVGRWNALAIYGGYGMLVQTSGSIFGVI